MKITILRLLALFSKKEKQILVVFFFAGLLGVFLETVGIGMILPVVWIFTNPDIIEKYAIAKKVYDFFGFTSHSAFMIGACLALMGIFLLKNLYLVIISWMQHKFLGKKQTELSAQILEHYIYSPYSLYLQIHSSYLSRNVSSVAPSLINPLFVSIMNLGMEICVVSSIFLLLFLADRISATVLVFALGSLTYSIFRFLRRKTKTMGHERHIYSVQYSTLINQGFHSIKDVRIVGCEEFIINSAKRGMDKCNRLSVYLQMVGSIPHYIVETAAVIAMLLIVSISIASGKPREAIVPTLSIFAVAAFRLMPSATRIINLAATISIYRAELDILTKEIDAVFIDKTPRWQRSCDDALSKARFESEMRPGVALLEINNVSFKYPASTELVLEDVSLKIYENEIVGIVGLSGGGKTTLLDLLLGFLEPTDGAVLVNGKNVNIDSHIWQSQIGYVPQYIYLYDDTIRKNVAFGLEDDEIDDEKVWKALRMAQLEEFVRGLPDQLQTGAGENGVRFSGGQRQRLGIARALYRNPRVLVFDEATSSLDIQTEREVTDAINHLAGSKTMIIVSHRPTAIEKCTKVFSVDKGKLSTVRQQVNR